MTAVSLSRLKLGQKFPDRDIITLHVAEEANYWGILFHTDKSNAMKMYCRGLGLFLVYATISDTSGWTITRCQVVLEKNDAQHMAVSSPTVPPTKNKLPRSPYKAAMIVPLIAKMIAETPMASNKVLRQILEPYGKPYCFTEGIIQGARTEARKLIFGDADENVGYAYFVKDELETVGHHVKLSFTTRSETMRNLDKIIIAEEAQRRNELNIEGLQQHERRNIVEMWKADHQKEILQRLGSRKDELHLKFLNGIFFAPSFVKETVPHLQKVLMADACHLNFGKYTLFLCYGITVNSNASPVAFAIIFGNESTSTWKQFWKYAIAIHGIASIY